jgi:ribosomal subunit interface protein
MQLSVTGKQIDIGQALQEHVTEALNGAVEKYFGNAMDGNVVFSREAHEIHAEITVHVGKGIQIQAHGTAGDAYSAFDLATEHMAKRLRRYKRRLRDHHRDRSQKEEVLYAAQYVLAQEEDMEPQAGEHAEPEQPVIVAEMQTHIERLSVGEAVMRMDLANLPAMLFRNSAHGGLNLVYVRADGNIGWVDPLGEGGESS